MLVRMTVVFTTLCSVLIVEVRLQAIIMKVDITKIGINNVQKNIKVNKLIFNAIRHDYYGSEAGGDYVEIPIRKQPQLIYDYIKQHLQHPLNETYTERDNNFLPDASVPGDLSDALSRGFRNIFRNIYKGY